MLHFRHLATLRLSKVEEPLIWELKSKFDLSIVVDLFDELMLERALDLGQFCVLVREEKPVEIDFVD